MGHAIDLAARTHELDPTSYEAVTTLARLHLALGRLQGDTDRLARALHLLEEASGLEGCQNRVQYLTASGKYDLAMLRRDRGEDPNPELAEVLVACREAMDRDQGAGPWAELHRRTLETRADPPGGGS